MTITHTLVAAGWAFVAGLALGVTARTVWDYRARIMEALRG